MTYLILGGSGSGKSAYAETVLSGLSSVKKKYYLATMQIYDEDGLKKVERHKKMREGKGFITLEQPRNIAKIMETISGKNSAVLLECMSNLTANEMFSDRMLSARSVVE